MIARLAAGVIVTTLLTGAVLAQGVAGEDFESGLGERWRGDPGRGDIRVTEYAGNHTLRLRRNAWAATVIPLDGARDVRVSAAFAAGDLEGADACLLETSIDGETWQEAGRVVDGQDDSVTLHRVGAAVPAADGRDWIAVRLRIDANGSNDTCWADDLRVDAAPEAVDLQTEIPVGDAPLDRPVAAAAFAPPAGHRPAEATVSGRLQLSAQASADGYRVHHDEFGYGDAAGIFAIPALDIGLAARDGVLRPVERGPRPGDSAHWEWVVQPGRIWRDGETWQVRLPVALQERNANCIHTGWLAVDWPSGGGEASGVLEIGAETCAYFKFDLWSRIEARFMPGDAPALPPEPAGLTRRPVDVLAEAFPGTDPAAFGSPLEVTPEAMTVYGLLAGEVLYAGGCGTRFGRDPFCEALPLPSYSLAKTLVAGLALMRLEHLYPGARQARIADFVPACAGARWDGVTFEHALDMATGLYTDAGFEADEGAPELWAFMTRTTHEGRIAQACAEHPRQAEPGTRWVYHTTDTYVLGTAMQAFWRERTGRPDADFYDDLLVPLWHALGLSPLMDTTRRSYDAVRQPVSGWGLTMTLDDMMRLGRFLQDGARLYGEAWADPAMIVEALQRAPEDRGLPAGGPTQRYQNGVWAWNAGPALGCAEDVWIPALSGYGGITLALIPNGHVYAYVSDGREFAWRRAAAASNAITPFCEVQP
jgi:hypothetical protein